jgi:hypothetical protein
MLVRVSCIQNTQIREETTTKVLGKVDTFWTYQARFQHCTYSHLGDIMTFVYGYLRCEISWELVSSWSLYMC